MTKFEEMCAAYTESRNAWMDYRNRSMQNLASLAQGFIQYCAIPSDNVAYRPPSKMNDPGTSQYSAMGAVEFSQDRYWEIGISTTLYESKDKFPEQPILIVLGLKEEGGQVIVRIGHHDGPTQQVDLQMAGQREGFYDAIIETVKKYFAKPDQMYSDATSKPKRIGF